MMKNLKFTALTLILLLTTFTSDAWHITGGEMSYECLGNNQYKITIRVYQEITNQQGVYFDNPLLLSIYDGNGQAVSGISNPIMIQYNNISNVVNNTFCATNSLNLQVANYETILSLPINTSGYHLSYQRCCLTQTVINIFNPNSHGLTLTTFISPLALNNCNSSPTFNTDGNSTFCIGNPITMDYSGNDIDGNTLFYSFSTPYDGLSQQNPAGVAAAPPYSSVPFIQPFSASQPLGLNIMIDSITGIISGNFNTIGTYYFGVTIADYQNGVLLSETQRIFLVQASSCSTFTDNYDINICNGQTYTMNGVTYDSTGIYQTATISTEGCNYTEILDLNIASEIALSDTTILEDNGSFNGGISFQMVDSTGNYTYLWSNADTTSSLTNINFGTYIVTITNENGCSESFEFEVPFDVNTRLIRNENFDIHIFPNPISVADFININIKAIEKSDLEISIINVNGQVLKTINQTIQKGENQIQSKLELPKGVYFILIKDNQHQLIERLPIVIP
jgi:hypothetical protein